MNIWEGNTGRQKEEKGRTREWKRQKSNNIGGIFQEVIINIHHHLEKRFRWLLRRRKWREMFRKRIRWIIQCLLKLERSETENSKEWKYKKKTFHFNEKMESQRRRFSFVVIIALCFLVHISIGKSFNIKKILVLQCLKSGKRWDTLGKIFKRIHTYYWTVNLNPLVLWMDQ